VLDLQSEQHGAGQAYLDLYEAVVDLKRRHDLHPCAVRPRDGLSLRKESERELVHELVRRFRNLPVEQQRKLPALLNSLAQLEVVVGELEAGQQDFEEVSRLVSDPSPRPRRKSRKGMQPHFAPGSQTIRLLRCQKRGGGE
jgi:hypothetical protein